jgi:hypothetical protein
MHFPGSQYNESQAPPTQTRDKKNTIQECHKKLLLSSIQRDKHLIDEYVALYIGMHSK